PASAVSAPPLHDALPSCFVPYDRKDPTTRPAGQLTERVDIGGLSRLPETEKPSFLIPDNDLAKNVFYWRDIPAMARSAGLDVERDRKSTRLNSSHVKSSY